MSEASTRWLKGRKGEPAQQFVGTGPAYFETFPTCGTNKKRFGVGYLFVCVSFFFGGGGRLPCRCSVGNVGMNPGVSLKDTGRDGSSRGHSNSFPAYSTTEFRIGTFSEGCLFFSGLTDSGEIMGESRDTGPSLWYPIPNSALGINVDPRFINPGLLILGCPWF